MSVVRSRPKKQQTAGTAFFSWCINCGEAKSYNKIIAVSVCVDSPSRRHTCGQQEKHTAFWGSELACSLGNVIRIMVNVRLIFRAKAKVCLATIFEEVEVSAKQHPRSCLDKVDFFFFFFRVEF